MASSLSNVINYCKTINGSLGFNDTKAQFINSMVQDYNEAHENAIYRFDVLINTIDAKDVYVNNSETTIKGIIDTSKKQTADTEIEQTIQVYPNQIKRGDYIKFKMNDTDELRTYLVKSKVDKKSSCDEAVFEECNHLSKWMYKGVLYKSDSILTNQTKYTLGTDVLSVGITEGSSRFQKIMSYNKVTKTISEGQRMIFNNKAWKVTQVDFVSDVGLMNILFSQTAINYEIDDIDNEIAGAFESKHTYTWNLPISFEVAQNDEYVLPYSIVDETGKEIDYSLVTVSTSDNTLVSINKTDKTITIKGLSVGIGSIKLDIPIGETVEEKIIAFEVKETIVNQVNYTTDFSQTTTIKQYVTSILQAKKYINGIQDTTLKISYSFDSVGQSLIASNKIVITRKSDSSIGIKNALVTTKTTVYLTVTDDSDGTKILDNQAIVLVNGI